MSPVLSSLLIVLLLCWLTLVVCQPQMPDFPRMPGGGPGSDAFQTQQAGGAQAGRSHPPLLCIAVFLRAP